MSGMFGRAADWLEHGRPVDGIPLCRHHGPACQMGAEPLSELYVLIIEAKRRAGEVVPPLDEHVPMTPSERARYEREVADLIAEKQAENAAVEAELNAGAP
ncbi:hypothetical protein ACFRDV_16615 [Streptomyces fagopyri]|uniref:hypothetical protein n=1 Tax=Streptomyces fagopyri TaxID=2662397 RepID=UPI0036A39FB8